MICFVCGHRLVQAVTGKRVEGVAMMVDGNAVRAHKACAKRESQDRDHMRLVETLRAARNDKTFAPRELSDSITKETTP